MHIVLCCFSPTHFIIYLLSLLFLFFFLLLLFWKGEGVGEAGLHFSVYYTLCLALLAEIMKMFERVTLCDFGWLLFSLCMLKQNLTTMCTFCVIRFHYTFISIIKTLLVDVSSPMKEISFCIQHLFQPRNFLLL